MRLARLKVATAPTVAMALVGAAVMGAALAGGVVVARSDAQVAANWRGSYDILVTSSSEDFGAVGEAGLVDPSFLGTARGRGISMDDLVDVRALAGVDVAAPMGAVGVIRPMAQAPSVWVTDDPEARTTVLPDATLAQITTTLTTRQMGEQRVVSRSAGLVALRPRSIKEVTDVNYRSPVPATVADSNGFSPTATNLGLYLSAGVLPAFATPIVAVDPAAEALLAPQAGRALSALQNLPASRSLTTKGAEWASAVDGTRFSLYRTLLEMGQPADGKDRTVVPLVVRDEPAQDMTVHVQIRTAPVPITAFPTDQASLKRAAERAQFTQLADLEKDASAVTVPFASPNLIMQWPGSIPLNEDATLYNDPDTLTPQTVSRPSYAAIQAPAGAEGFRVAPGAEVDAAGLPVSFSSAAGTDPAAGLVRAYRDVQAVSGPGLAEAVPAPVGTFALSDLADPDADAASFVPTGILPASTTLASTGQAVAPNASNLDFITPQPGAFTDLAGGATLRGKTPIDVIRVRVAGVDDYSQASRDRIERVARDIAALGLKATVVAGSSLREVPLFVPEYWHEGGDAWSDLGWVNQEWTSLGATQVVTAAVSATQRLVIWGVTAVACLGVLVVCGMWGLTRRGAVQVMTAAGWTSGRIGGHLLTRLLPGLVLVIAACTAAVLLGTQVGRMPAVVAAVSAVVAAVVGVFIALHQRQAGRVARTGGSVLSLPGLGVRRALTPRAAKLLVYLSAVVVVAVAGLATAAVFDAWARADATRLGQAVLSATVVPTVALSVAGLGIGVVLAVIGRRIEAATHAHDDHVLSVAGVDAARRRTVDRADSAATAGLVLVLTVVVVAVLAAAVHPAGLALAVPAVVGVVVAAAQFAGHRRQHEGEQ